MKKPLFLKIDDSYDFLKKKKIENLLVIPPTSGCLPSHNAVASTAQSSSSQSLSRYRTRSTIPEEEGAAGMDPSGGSGRPSARRRPASRTVAAASAADGGAEHRESSGTRYGSTWSSLCNVH